MPDQINQNQKQNINFDDLSRYHGYINFQLSMTQDKLKQAEQENQVLRQEIEKLQKDLMSK